MRELTLKDMISFEEWLYEQCGKRDMEVGMKEVGQMRSMVELLRIAGVEKPEDLPFTKLEETVKELGLPFSPIGKQS